MLQNNGFRNRDEQETVDGLHLFHEGLGSKRIDCDNTSFVYLSIADALKLPLAAVSAPDHLFVRLGLNNGRYINWETTFAGEMIDNQYIYYQV